MKPVPSIKSTPPIMQSTGRTTNRSNPRTDRPKSFPDRPNSNDFGRGTRPDTAVRSRHRARHRWHETAPFLSSVRRQARRRSLNDAEQRAPAFNRRASLGPLSCLARLLHNTRPKPGPSGTVQARRFDMCYIIGGRALASGGGRTPGRISRSDAPRPLNAPRLARAP